jgi:hypothetical protein
LAARKRVKEGPGEFFSALRGRVGGDSGPSTELLSPVTFALLFEHCNWGGQSLFLPPGTYPDFRVVSWANWNDRVSSLQLFLVAVWLWEDIWFKGAVKTFAGVIGNTGTTPAGFQCLVHDGFNDRASSAIVL